MAARPDQPVHRFRLLAGLVVLAVAAGPAHAMTMMGGGDERIVIGMVDVDAAAMLASVHSHDESGLRRGPAAPPPTTFAPVDDVAAVPLRSDPGRHEYRRFLAAPSPRAFAIAEDGSAWAWNSDDPEAMADAVTQCRARAKGPCRLYAVDADVVWTGPKPER